MSDLTWLADVLRAGGCKVEEFDGWRTRGHGTFGRPLGIICHHTATPGTGNYPSKTTVMKGRPGLAGPLCNLGLGRDGTWYVCAAGVAWHAGTGGPYKGVYHGNLNMIGVEAENRGYVKGPNADFPWPKIQMDAYALGCAVILDHIGQPVSMCIGHKEWAPKRKVDPTFDMTAFRQSVAAYMGKPKGTLKGAVFRYGHGVLGRDETDPHLDMDGCRCKRKP